MLSKTPISGVFITDELDRRIPQKTDYLQEKLALQELAARMVEKPEEILPRFVERSMEMTGGISAGLSLYEKNPAPGIFRWRYLRGTLLPFEGATTPREFSPCGVTLDQNCPILAAHPERVYSWISDANIIVPEVLLVPLYIHGKEPLGTLWVVSDKEGSFDRGHARAITELASFVGVALRMVQRQKTENYRAAANGLSAKGRSAKSFVPASFLANVGDGRTITKYRKKQKIFSQGDPADLILFIQKGRVKVSIISENGKDAIMAILEKGDFCGEGCLNGQTRRTVTARALSDCEITRIEKTILARALHDEPSLSAIFLRHILRRTIQLEADLVNQFFNSSEKRLARALLMLANVDNESDAGCIITKISQKTLAEMIGTTRPRVNLFMKKFRMMGFISYIDTPFGGDSAGGLTVKSSLKKVLLGDLPSETEAESRLVEVQKAARP